MLNDEEVNSSARRQSAAAAALHFPMANSNRWFPTCMDFRAMPITVSSFFMHHHDHHQGTRVFNKLTVVATCWPQIADQRGPHWKLSRNHRVERSTKVI